MQTDWSVECAADDPWVVVPWACKDKAIHYIDLRSAPERINEVPEAARYTSLAAALTRWNRQGSPIFTAKCDVWHYSADSFDANDLPGFRCAHGSYVDLLSSRSEIFSDFSACENLLKKWSANAEKIPLPSGRCEWTLRRSRIFPVASADIAATLPAKPIDGFAATFYAWGYGSSAEHAEDAWAASLAALTEPVIFLAAS